MEAQGNAPDSATRQRLRDKWIKMNADIMSGVPMVLPPLRDINHRIQLVDEGMRYHYYSPRCPESMRLQLKEKLIQYEDAGWWVRNTTEQAAPMMCIPKKKDCSCPGTK